MVHRLLLLLLVAAVAQAADWGATINGLRLSLSTDATGQNITFTFENTEDRREMFLWLGTVGVGEAEKLHLNMISAAGKRERLMYTGGNGVAPGRLIPMIVPLLPGSTYSIKTSLSRWYRPNHVPLDRAVLRESTLEAEFAMPQDVDFRFVDCFGLRIFWHGNVRSNSLRIP